MTASRARRHEFLAEAEWQSWNAVLMVNRVVLRELDAELRRHDGISVSEFDVLITLFNADERRVGMSALADRVLLSPAGTTHLVTRLERDRLVRREVHPEDGRKAYAVLTAAGDAKLQAARRTHNAVLRRTFLAVTTANERRLLQRMWRRLSSAASVS